MNASIVFAAGLFLSAAAAAQTPSQADTDTLVQLGRLATLGSICSLRDESWAFDLRRAAIQSATRSQRFDDPALRAAPGSAEAQAALGYAEAESLEDFADTPPEQTCGPLASSPDLKQADDIVRAFRAQARTAPGS